MKIFFDTEFIEDGKTIDLLSVGMVREDGAELYMENVEAAFDRADEWVKQNVLVHLQGGNDAWERASIRDNVLEFAGESPEFWAYYADYDWVVLCQLFGRMIDLPKGWPMYCRDLKQAAGRIRLPKQEGAEHHALADAKWVKSAHEWLMEQPDAFAAHREAAVRDVVSEAMAFHNLTVDGIESRLKVYESSGSGALHEAGALRALLRIIRGDK